MYFVDFFECPVCTLKNHQVSRTRFYSRARFGERIKNCWCEVCGVMLVKTFLGREESLREREK